MDDPEPSTATSLDDLAACLRHVHLLADKPTYRALEQRTTHERGLLPGTSLRRVRLGRTTVSDVLLGRKFPGKAFLLTFVEACGVDVAADRRWEQTWDRLAVQYRPVGAGEAETLRQENEALRQQLIAAENRAEAAQAENRGSQANDWRYELLVRQVDLARVVTLYPRTYNEVRLVGEHFREGTPVIINLAETPDSDGMRMVDFGAGLIFGLRGSIERVTDRVFLLLPANVEVTAEDKARIAERGFFSQNSTSASNDPDNNTGAPGSPALHPDSVDDVLKAKTVPPIFRPWPRKKSH